MQLSVCSDSINGINYIFNILWGIVKHDNINKLPLHEVFTVQEWNLFVIMSEIRSLYRAVQKQLSVISDSQNL